MRLQVLHPKPKLHPGATRRVQESAIIAATKPQRRQGSGRLEEVKGLRASGVEGLGFRVEGLGLRGDGKENGNYYNILGSYVL